MYICKHKYMNTAYLLIGGNTGERLQNLTTACNNIEEQIGRIVKQSAVYETAAWGSASPNAFLNQVIQVQTSYRPKEILNIALGIEKQMGRKRLIKNEDRIIDIDILFINDDIILGKGLRVPHPLLQDRKFTLIPLAEIAPNYVHPIFEKTITTLLAECTDTLNVGIYIGE